MCMHMSGLPIGCNPLMSWSLSFFSICLLCSTKLIPLVLEAKSMADAWKQGIVSWGSLRRSLAGLRGFFLWKPPLGSFPNPPQCLQLAMPSMRIPSWLSGRISRLICPAAALVRSFPQVNRLIPVLRVSPGCAGAIVCLKAQCMRRLW